MNITLPLFRIDSTCAIVVIYSELEKCQNAFI